MRSQVTHLSPRVLVMHENKGIMVMRSVEFDKDFDQQVVTDILQSHQDQARISKATTRALKVCRWCPHKQRCDALDKLHGEDTDWHPDYPTP